MRLFICWILVWPIVAVSQVDSTDLPPDRLFAYLIHEEQPCIGYELDEVLSVDEVARMFRTTAGAIYRENRVLTYRPPQRGDILNVPVRMSELLGLFRYSAGHRPVYYTVRQGETLFRIARQYFDLPVDILMQLNHLDKPDLAIGQQLLLGYVEVTVKPTADEVVPVPRPDTLEYDPFANEEVLTDRGVALWNKEHPEFHHLFAMHRNARINSMIEITNPMFGTTVLVKVVGKIPRTFSNDIAIVVSPGVARQLGAIDSRFYVQLRYVK
ncbi:MAG: LysM peptidoglycan-binding domain-containing protein [Saprospiraceae bacterium]|nr:LysM peptidoglycan-binding domain-containing protein [Saprospiraceae bacterium]